MPPPKTVMDIFRHLDKSNCRQCGEKTCLAFAGKVFQGIEPLKGCPKLDPLVLADLGAWPCPPDPAECAGTASLTRFREAVASLDLQEAARRIGGRYRGGRLTLQILGKDFSVDSGGNFYGDIHVNPWVAVPFLYHVLHGKGSSPTGEWVSFRELREGRERYPLFQKRCEAAIRQVADTYTDLFDDLTHLFNGKAVAPQFQSDISVVLHPLPKVPLMICYWRPEGNLASSLNLFWDRTADENCDIGSLFTLGAGLAAMFAKIALRHGFL